MRVLVIDIDSLRPDHLGCYGYDRDTSPTIDRIADGSARFERCYVSDSPCLPSRTALATCRHGIKSGVVTHYGDGQWYDNPGTGHDLDDDRIMSFQHLSHNDVYTASVSSFAERHMAYHFSGAFQESIQPTAETGLLAVEDASDVTAAATTWLDAHATDDDWLLHVNYWDVHHPYLGIEEYVDEVRGSGEPAAFPDEETIADQRGMAGARTADLWPNPSEYGSEAFERKYEEWSMPERVEERADAERFIDGYDAAIRKVDDEVAVLLDRLDSAGVLEDTAVVVTGDHGESLGEHGVYAEHALPHPPCQRVPLIVSWPGVTDGDAGAVDEFVYQFDLMATVCDLLDVDVPDGWDAEPFTPALTGDGFNGREFVVSGHGIYTFGRAVYEDDWVYVRLLNPGAFVYPGMFNDPDSLPGEGLELLHDLDADPHMTENLVGDRPEVADRLRSRLDGWVADAVSTDWKRQRPVGSRGRDPLAAMATYGPYLYLDPGELLDLYRELGRSDEQVASLERTIAEYPDRPSPEEL